MTDILKQLARDWKFWLHLFLILAPATPFVLYVIVFGESPHKLFDE